MERITRKDYVEHRARVVQAKFKVDCRLPAAPIASNSRTRRMTERNHTTLTDTPFSRTGSTLSATPRRRPSNMTTIASMPHKMKNPVIVARMQVQTSQVPDMLKVVQQASMEEINKNSDCGDGENYNSDKSPDTDSNRAIEYSPLCMQVMEGQEEEINEKESQSQQLLQFEHMDNEFHETYPSTPTDKYNEKDTAPPTSTSSATTVTSQAKRTNSLKDIKQSTQRGKQGHDTMPYTQTQSLAKSKTAPSPLYKTSTVVSSPSIPQEQGSYALNPKAERDAVKVLKPKDSREVMVTISYAVSAAVIRHYEHMTFFMPKPALLKILRPRFFMELQSHSRKYSRTLGRLCFQLFTEASPGIVLEIARCCNLPRGHEQMSITRIFDPMWVEGDICVDKRKGIRNHIQLYNEHVLSHRIGAGILSFSLQTKRSLITEREIISFSISLSSLEVPPGRRVALGIIAEGIDVLRNIKKFATKSGKPTDKIIVTRCGIVMQ